MIETELEFLRRRTTEELEIAEGCPIAAAAEVHRRLALLYAQRVAEMRATAWPDMAEPMAMPPMEDRAQ